MVQTCTCLPAACARRTRPGVAITHRPCRCGTCSAATRPRVSRSASRPLGSSRKAATSSGCAEVGDARAGQPPERVEAPGRERPDQHPVLDTALADERRQGRHGAVRLQVDVEAGQREGVEELGERRHPFPTADQRLPDLRAGEPRDGAAPVADPVEDQVVERQQRAVAGDVDVGLEVAVAQRRGVPEGRHRVLQALELGVVGAAAVGEGQHRRSWGLPGSSSR